ncbi:acyl carrier protein [Eubacterium pyruvativorans]|uniref:acyl carrier protein n=1 Tax=Eubacterium pyruvativorans TaxID=155865 RepID=UPI001567C001|nr:acyl carrier protein [Eubacterium pyruvativorans]MDD6708032.1 acyl carrier protein [Eubacterium pyruvativorans]MDY4049215.1 acyl carrier protein [Eubacterium pyruvativorans]
MKYFDEIKGQIVDFLGVDEAKITSEAKLKEDLGIDSLDAVELAMAIEEAFDIKIDDEDLKKLITVQDIVNCVEKNTAAK